MPKTALYFSIEGQLMHYRIGLLFDFSDKYHPVGDSNSVNKTAKL